jgi:ABC-2 type transport system ATP-binding protein
MLEIRQLERRFGARRALDDVSLDVQAGEAHLLLGPNGAGKSTLLRVAAGCLPPTAGQVVVGGHDLLEAPLQARRHVGYLPEGCPLYDDLRVAEHLRYRGRLKGLHGRRLRARLRHVVEACGLDGLQQMLVGRLSLGERRRVALADALLADPRLLLLDEPFAGLDPWQAERTCALLAGMTRRGAILMATSRLDLAARLCRGVTVLAGGRVAASCAPEEGLPSPERLRELLAETGGTQQGEERA